MRYLCRAAAFAVCLFVSFATTASELRVLYAESFRPRTSGLGVQKTSSTNELQFSAFGRVFTLELQENGALLRNATPAVRASIGVYKGVVRDVPGSWVRLTELDGAYRGAFWDGADLYAIDSATNIAAATVVPFARTSGTAIYRLSDTQGGLLEGTCGAETDASQKPLDRYRNLTRELRSMVHPKIDAAREITVAMIGDYEFVTSNGLTSTAALIDRANVSDGIFSSQVGISIVPTDFLLYPTDSDPFTQTDPRKLLTQVADFRASTSPIRERGIAHLVTGRELDGTVVGVGYRAGACDVRAGASLSQASLFIDSALVMAHEIGHNLGASHDAEGGSECVATPATYLMAPRVNGSSTLSACSVQSINREMANVACVVPRRDRDVAVSSAVTHVKTSVGTPFEVNADVSALGSNEALNITAILRFEGPGVVHSATLDGGTCTINHLQATCSLTQLPAGESRRLTATITPNVAGQANTTVKVSSWNDTNATNDSLSWAVETSASRDIRITANPQPVNALMGEPFNMTFDVLSSGPLGLNDVHVSFYLPTINIVSAGADAGTCTISPSWSSSVTCNLGAIASGVLRKISLQLISNDDGERGFSIDAIDTSVQPIVSKSHTFMINTQPRRDLAIAFQPPVRRFAVGVTNTWNVEVQSRGVETVSGAKMRIEPAAWLPDLHLTFPSSCTLINTELECSLASIAPGEKVTIPIGLRVDELVNNGHVIARLVQTPPDDLPGNDQTSASFIVLPPLDAAVYGAGASLHESKVGTMSFTIFSRGAHAIESGSVSINIPDSMDVQTASMEHTTCTITSSPERVTCPLPRIEGGEGAQLGVTFIASQAGQFTGSIEVNVPGDADPTNNSQTLYFNVHPFVDAQLQATVPPTANLTTSPVKIAYTATTNKYALPDASFYFSWYGDVTEVTIEVPGSTCRGSVAPLRCDLGDLAANSTTAVSVFVRAEQRTRLWIQSSLLSAADSDSENNNFYANFAVHAPADLDLQLTQSQVNASVGTYEFIPAIKVAGKGIVDAFVEFDFDSTQVTNFNVVGATCTAGSKPLRCTFNVVDWAPAQLQIALTPTTAGTILIGVKVGAFNDITPANNTAQITVQATAPPPTPPAPATTPVTSRKGGGGSADLNGLLGLLALASLATRRRRSHKRLSITS